MNNYKTIIKEIRNQVKEIENNPKLKAERRLPSNCYFLSEDSVLSYRRKDGDARYPYSCDGLTFWAYESGNVKMEESTLNILLSNIEGKDPYLSFFVGVKQKDGSYFPVSLLGPARQPIEPNIKRYTVFTPQAVYYFTDTPDMQCVVRMLVDDKKLLRASICIENVSYNKIDIYLSMYMNFFMMQQSCETIETKWFKQCTATDYGFLMHTTETRRKQTSLEHYAAIVCDSSDEFIEKTTSRRVFAGGLTNHLNCSESLFQGYFGEKKMHTEFSETAIAGTIQPKLLNAQETYTISYTVAFGNESRDVINRATNYKDSSVIDEFIDNQLKNDKNSPLPKIYFDDIAHVGLKSFAINSFIKNVLRQVDFCARAKNYAGPFIGVRDIFQQLESSLIWNPEYARQKIIEALSFVGDDGRCPRQYSYPQTKEVLPTMDLRPFIDQGVWVISTVFSYLTYTGDYSILDEICGYYKLIGNTVDFSLEKDTVLDHLVRITEYLISNLANDTGCLRALYGDWNDALDGLGYTKDQDREYGDGVSVMATLQLYKNLDEMCQIFCRVNRYVDKIEEYKQYRERIKTGLQQHAIVSNSLGDRKIVHGWGDKLSYKIASFCDNDGLSRDGLTSNAFWILCGAIDWDKSIKKDILCAYDRLDSKYGLKTFEPYFAEDNQEVGRIIKLPKGTAENGATYIHATLFAILSLFELGEAKRAWEQLYKILPLTHTTISTTPFIMSNSYIYNEEKGLDGESMNDWFTGSGCVLIKALIWYVFGVKATLDGLYIRPANYMPFENASLKLKIKGANITISFCKSNDGVKKFVVNGKEKECIYDDKTNTFSIYFSNEELNNELNIEIN